MINSLERIRTDVVGSLLRPARWKEARLQLELGKLPAADFAAVELDCVRVHLAPQENAGLGGEGDGEVSRLNFQDSFGLAVSGYDTATENVATHERRAVGGTPLAR